MIAWCCQATSHYLSQYWTRFMSPYGVNRLQQSGTKPNLVAKILATKIGIFLVTSGHKLPKLVANISSEFHHLVNTELAVGSLIGPIFCLLFRVSSDYAHPITGQVTEVTCTVIGQAQPQLNSEQDSDKKRALVQPRAKSYNWSYFFWHWPNQIMNLLKLLGSEFLAYYNKKLHRGI